MKFSIKLEKTATETFNLLKEIYGNECLSLARVFEWFKCFQDGREVVPDDSRPSRPFTSKTDDNIEKIGNLIRFDHQLNVRVIAETVRIEKESEWQMLHNNFNMQKACAKMVLKIITFEQQ